MANPADTGTFETLLAPHLDALLRTAERLTGSASDAEDLVQESLLKGLRFFDRFERDTNFKAWIFKILMNGFVNTYRARKRRGPSVDVDAVSEALTADEPADVTAERPTFNDRESMMFELVDERVKQALMELPEELRTVFLLSAVEGFKYREIADIMDCPVGTVMSRLFRGRAMLKERLTTFAREAGYLRDESA